MPCVATSIAVEGLGLKQGENILVGDTPENFAQEVVTLYTDKRLWDHLSISGLSFVKAHWSIQVGERKLTEFLGQLMGIAFCSSVSHFRNTQTATCRPIQIPRSDLDTNADDAKALPWPDAIKSPDDRHGQLEGLQLNSREAIPPQDFPVEVPRWHRRTVEVEDPFDAEP